MSPKVTWCALVSVAWALAAGCASDDERPTCSASNRDCGEGWNCVESTRPLCPRICDPDYTCIAQGILEPGRTCIADGECVEGAYCRSVGDGSGRSECAQKECETHDQCPIGESCEGFECTPTLGSSCNRDRGAPFGCSAGEICAGAICVRPPAEGGNFCADDTYCAEGLECTSDPAGADRCTTCTNDDECDADGPYCVNGHCDVCTDASCAPGACEPGVGCVECRSSADCPEGRYCEDDSTCRIHCTRNDDEACPSGACSFWEYCVKEFGTPCETPSDDSDECWDGVCADVDATGAPLEPYCTRTCYPGVDVPCGEGSVCVMDLTLPDGTVDACLAT